MSGTLSSLPMMLLQVKKLTVEASEDWNILEKSLEKQGQEREVGPDRRGSEAQTFSSEHFGL